MTNTVNYYQQDNEDLAFYSTAPRAIKATAPAQKPQVFHVAQKIGGQGFGGVANRVFAIRFTGSYNQACSFSNRYFNGEIEPISQATLENSVRNGSTYLPTVYNRSLVMKRAANLRKQGKNASDALKQAWAEHKAGRF